MTARALQLDLEVYFIEETDAEYAERMIPVLKPIAHMLGQASRDRRITVADVRHVAQSMGIFTGLEKGRRLSFIHEVMPKAGFEPTAAFERSDLPQAHRNLNRVWYLPETVVR